ncbi:MAG: dipicolinate synthase subunit DpsA [Clostridia bacterium]|nr:dipicolinate synthase subunit DpsA [Clostridia bacterium]
MNNKVFAVIGGDMRQAFIYKSLRSDGIEAVPFGVPGYVDSISDIQKLINISDIIILPMPATKDGTTVNAPFSEKIIYIDELLQSAKGKGKIIFAGALSKELLTKADDLSITLIDYLQREELAVLNAVPTVEGAVEIAMKNTDFTLFKSKCLVTGYGRIGKILSRTLQSLGADVTVAARKTSDLAWIKAEGYEGMNIYELSNLHKYDIIFNTVPHLIFKRQQLQQLSEHCLIIDLASLNGGVDFEYAKELKLNAIHALSLPGKVAPKSAALIIKDTIFNYLREECL